MGCRYRMALRRPDPLRPSACLGYRDWRKATLGSRIPFATRSARLHGGADDKSSALITVAEFFMDIAELLACLDGDVRVSFFAFIRNVPTDLSTAREFGVVWIVFLIAFGFLISHLNSSVTSFLRGRGLTALRSQNLY
jgi:hypothetical protein